MFGWKHDRFLSISISGSVEFTGSRETLNDKSVCSRIMKSFSTSSDNTQQCYILQILVSCSSGWLCRNSNLQFKNQKSIQFCSLRLWIILEIYFDLQLSKYSTSFMVQHAVNTEQHFHNNYLCMQCLGRVLTSVMMRQIMLICGIHYLSAAAFIRFKWNSLYFCVFNQSVIYHHPLVAH